MLQVVMVMVGWSNGWREVVVVDWRLVRKMKLVVVERNFLQRRRTSVHKARQGKEATIRRRQRQTDRQTDRE
jgi:hypothetical protein